MVGSPTPITTANQALDPEKSETFELGAKFALFDGKLGLIRLAVPGGQGQRHHHRSQHRRRAAAVQPEAAGAGLRILRHRQGAADNLNIIAAYTYLNPVITRDNSVCTTSGPLVCNPNPYTIGRQITFVPKHAASLWADYNAKDLAGRIVVRRRAGLSEPSVQRLHGRGHRRQSAGPRIVVIPETVEMDAVAAYEFSDYRLALNVNNLADRLYYSQSFGNRGTPAPGRTFIVSLDAKP